tara:strand:+ start:265 stop:537 length:273 start_codon:yes stop_codon:yes gene_type:complete
MRKKMKYKNFTKELQTRLFKLSVLNVLRDLRKKSVNDHHHFHEESIQLFGHGLTPEQTQLYTNLRDKIDEQIHLMKVQLFPSYKKLITEK